MENEMKKSVKELKELIQWIMKFITVTGEALEDGFNWLVDLPKFFGVVTGAGAAIGGIDQIPKEVADMDDDELRNEIEPIVRELKLPVGADQYEETIEEMILIAICIWRLIIKFKS